MTQTAYKPDSVPQLMPYLTVRDASKSLEFFQNAFGFETGDEPFRDENGIITHADVHLGDAHIMFGPEGAYGAESKSPRTQGVLPSISLYVYCEDVDALYARALKAGAQSLMEPNDSFWGDRICKVSDIDGHEWMFATLLQTR